MNGIYELNVGQYDYYAYDSEQTGAVNYYTETAGGDYTYNNDGTFTNTPAIGDHDVSTITPIDLQSVDQSGGSDSIIDAYIETVNYSFINDLSSSTISLFIDTAISMGIIEIKYASDTNYTHNSVAGYLQSGSTAETSSFANDNVRYVSSKQIKKSMSPLGVRNGYSVSMRFNIPTVADKVDDFILYSIKLVGDNLYFEGGDHGQSRT